MAATHRLVLILALVVLVTLFSSDRGVCTNDEGTMVLRGHPLTLRGRLLTNGTFGDPVPYEPVILFDETMNIAIGTTLTGPNGDFCFVWTPDISYPLGPTSLNVTYRGNEALYLLPSFQRIIVTVLGSVSMELIVENTDVYYGDLVVGTVRLLDDVGSPLQDQPVCLLSGDRIVTLLHTDDEGFAHFEFDCNESYFAEGHIELRAIYEGSTSQYYTPSQVSTWLNVHRIATRVEFLAELPREMMLNEPLEIPLAILPAISAEVVVQLDRKPYATILTDQTGEATLLLAFPVGTRPGPHELTLSYSGSSRYAPCSTSSSFEVVTSVFVLTEMNNPLVLGQVGTIVVWVYDMFRVPLDDVAILLEDTASGVTSSATVQNDFGRVSFSVPIEPPLGPRDIKFRILDNPYVVNGTWTLSCTVWCLPILEKLDCSVDGYAFPNQSVLFAFAIRVDADNCIPEYVVLVLCNGSMHHLPVSVDGRFTLTLRMPVVESNCTLNLIAPGDPSVFRLEVQYSTTVLVTRRIPLAVEILSYHTVPLHRILSVTLIVRGLNGSTMGGLPFSYCWLTLNDTLLTSPEGLVELLLPMPLQPGSHALTCVVHPSWCNAEFQGTFYVLIDSEDILLSQGIDPNVLTYVIVISIALGLFFNPRRRRI
ncbi:MAG: Ig-like domain-containing protein [Candidatus Thorarchaeota archaeon]